MSADIAELRLALRRKLARESFADFVRMVWPAIEPTRPMLPSIAIDALCAALQAVAEGRIKRIAIALPPGVSKSLIGAVAFPAWLLLRSGGRARAMVGSYSWSFAERDSRRCRDLCASPVFAELVGTEWRVRSDADTRADFWTTTGGRRLIVSVGGKALGERCTVQIVDDALSGADVLSKAAKQEATRWVCEVLPSRLENPDEDPRVVIGQRLSVDDPIAAVLERGWTLLCLPAMLAEGEAPCVLLADDGTEVWRDPRAPGEPLVSLLSADALEKLRLELGSVAFTAQYMQRPRDDSSATIRRAWWRFHRPPHVSGTAPRPGGCDTEHEAINTPEEFDRIVVAADLTFGSLTGDYAAIQAWASKKGARFLLDAWRSRCGFEEQLAAIKRMAEKFPSCAVVVEKAANGAAVIEQLRKVLPGVIAVKPIGSKAARIAAVAPAVESGACHLPLGAPWLEDFIEELAGATKHDDAQDAAAYALHELAKRHYDEPLFGGFVSEPVGLEEFWDGMGYGGGGRSRSW